jgi:DNA invertase Pin-like site-specific DNA recombinase
MQNFKFVNLNNAIITAQRLKRKAIIYLRQSTRENPGTRPLCESQVQLAQAYGFAEPLIEVINDDIGKSGFSVDDRSGYRRMLADIANNAVGIVLAASAFRLTRQSSAYEELRRLAADHGTLLCVGNRFTDPSDRPGRTSNEN